MNRFKLFNRSVHYSLKLVYKSSGLLMFLYLLVSLFCATFPLFGTYVLKRLLDLLIVSTTDMRPVFLYVALYILAVILLQVLNSAKTVSEASLIARVQHEFDCGLTKKLITLPMSVLDSSAGMDMVDDVRYSRNTVSFLVPRIVIAVSLLYTFCIAFATLMSFHILFSLLFLLLTVPGIILNAMLEQKAEDLRLRTAPDVRKFSYYRWMLTDAWPAKDVRMYDLTDPIRERYDFEKNEYRKANKQLDRKKNAGSMAAELIRRSGEIAFTVYVIQRGTSGEITVGDVALYMGFAVSASDAFQSLVEILVMAYTRTTDCMGRVFDFFAIPCPDEKTGTRQLQAFQSMTFDNVYFRYPNTDKYVLSGVSFTLNRGDKLSIVGINGSGKSTIVKLMLGLYEIESGQILINDHPMSDYRMRDVRRLFSTLFQNFAEYPLTLRDNVALSDYENADRDDRITASLKQSGVYDELQPKLRQGLDSYMTRNFDDRGTELSKGQWQKVALSRVYFKDAPIVIFDEPSAALDAEAENRIFQDFEAISENRTGIMISHRISAARMSNKILVLDHGQIAESGTHDELVALGGLYSRLYRLQREKYIVTEGIENE